MQLELKKSFVNSDTALNCMKIPKGFSIGKHVHPHDHFSALVSGKVSVVIGGKDPIVLDGFEVIEIEKDTSHVITALEDSVWMCIHSKPAMNDAGQLHLVGE